MTLSDGTLKLEGLKTTSACDGGGFQLAFHRKKPIIFDFLAELLWRNFILVPESFLWFEIDRASFLAHKEYLSGVVACHLPSQLESYFFVYFVFKSLRKL